MTEEDFEYIECTDCGDYKYVEKGTSALEKCKCQSCYCMNKN